ncbi:LysM peptidoglycan-binding domain-containing protein [Jeotgalibacillus salarius]|uniref:LysM peptidoglycan-binding domain-containing protein n=1 Tax=Jeotgalibacillus salarius TaxID=546023 RepID=A0A4Y8LEH2_9BACL|nr:LysM peptidoglycan-binding domain-containing protein [Jeotgalibacillus salarius]TFE00579.1 LysM peptidoglycan-binding domain-containing protein [Jeotgalibacillus salarius]
MPIVSGTHHVYTVQPGDTLYSIARRFGSSVSDIESANALYPPFTDPGLIFPGQVLIVTRPGTNQTNHIIAPGNNLYRLAQRYSTTVDLLFGINTQLTDPGLIFVDQMLLVPAFVYQVKSGDTLNRIATMFGVSLSELLQANAQRPGLSPDVIFPGYRLLIPLPSSNNIVVFRPLPATRISRGTMLAGFARAFEGAILYKIVDDSGTIVTNEAPIQTSAGGPAFGSYSIPMKFDRSPSAQTGELWVYARSANDGSIVDLVKVRVLF